MDYHYHYVCSQCGRSFSASKVEENLIYLCPECGAAPPGEPLKGVLEIHYDYSQIARQLTAADFLNLTPGIPWRFPQLWPLQWDQSNQTLRHINPLLLNNLTLPPNSLLKFSWNNQPFFILDETRNPTFSFKDRASILVVLKALQMGITEIAAASTGNAGSSLAGICARSGLKAQIWVPEAIPQAKLLQIKTYGAIVHKVKGDYDLAFDESIRISLQKRWYNRNTAFNPLTIEGKKSAAYDIFIQTRGQLPESIFVPVGDGVIIAGLYKGFWELLQLGWIDKLPRLIAVQSSGSNALIRFLKEKQFHFKPAHTIADSIAAGAPRNLYLAARAVEKSGGLAIEVSDQQILEAQALLARNFGLLAEPAAAAAYAGFFQQMEQGKIANDSLPLVLITGNGLKDVQALEQGLKLANET